jgi:hypothetical protein
MPTLGIIFSISNLHILRIEVAAIRTGINCRVPLAASQPFSALAAATPRRRVVARDVGR